MAESHVIVQFLGDYILMKIVANKLHLNPNDRNCVHIAQTQTDHKMVSGHMNSRHTVFEALVELRILLLLVLLKNLQRGGRHEKTH